MQNLTETITALDAKPIQMYTKLYGNYFKNGIAYYIKNIYGGQVKYCSVDITVDADCIYGDYSYLQSDSTAISSHILREFSAAAYVANQDMQLDEDNILKGCFMVYKYGQNVLPCSVVSVSEEKVTVSLEIKLPFTKSAAPSDFSALKMNHPHKQTVKNLEKAKSIISSKALNILLVKNMPKLTEDFIGQFDSGALLSAIMLCRNQNFIRGYLRRNGYVAFIGNGSILPRRGKTDYKDPRGAVAFQSPPSMEITVNLPSGGAVSGMAIKKGVTIITGDAYHGKSTIIGAVQSGIYNHCAGDGREYVITDGSAQSIKAEDGRSIKNADISYFLTKLPVKEIDPAVFSTDNASGSTSQAAAVYEAIESGCRLMLFDEDRSANNFMY